jgi:hypothetical protein
MKVWLYENARTSCSEHWNSSPHAYNQVFTAFVRSSAVTCIKLTTFQLVHQWHGPTCTTWIPTAATLETQIKRFVVRIKSTTYNAVIPIDIGFKLTHSDWKQTSSSMQGVNGIICIESWDWIACRPREQTFQNRCRDSSSCRPHTITCGALIDENGAITTEKCD